MNEEVFRSFSDIAVKEIAPGFLSKFIHTANNTLNFIEVKAGNLVPLHQHIHEQLSFVLEGKFEMTVNGVAKMLEPNVFAVIPPNIIHGGIAITDCKLIDVFSPVREDYKNLKWTNSYRGAKSKYDLEIPVVAEFTFLRNDRINSREFAAVFPHPLDVDNENKASLVLPQCWYKKV